jgi:hypothetical protein
MEDRDRGTRTRLIQRYRSNSILRRVATTEADETGRGTCDNRRRRGAKINRDQRDSIENESRGQEGESRKCSADERKALATETGGGIEEEFRRREEGESEALATETVRGGRAGPGQSRRWKGRNRPLLAPTAP